MSNGLSSVNDPIRLLPSGCVWDVPVPVQHLHKGSRYLPGADADVAVFADAVLPVADGGPLSAVGPLGCEILVAETGAVNGCFATRDLFLYEVDWATCGWLMRRSARFRHVYLEATSTQLRRLHERRSSAGGWDADLGGTGLLSVWPYAARH